MTDDDKEFIIRALAMHAALTRIVGNPQKTMDERCHLYEKWIRRSIANKYAEEMDIIEQDILARRKARDEGDITV